MPKNRYLYLILVPLLALQASSALAIPDYTRTYQYDSIGNMTSNSALGTMNYTNNQPHQLSSYPGKTLSYDNAGNVLNNFVNEMTYDWRSRVVE